MQTYSLTMEPRGSAYGELLGFALDRCHALSLVIQPRLELSDRGTAFVDELRPYLIESNERATEWPGTVLLSGAATLLRATFNSSTRDLVGSAATGLYDWRQPKLPEDLALFRPSGEALLGSIAHESDAFLQLSHDEVDELRHYAPRVAALLGDATSD